MARECRGATFDDGRATRSWRLAEPRALASTSTPPASDTLLFICLIVRYLYIVGKAPHRLAFLTPSPCSKSELSLQAMRLTEVLHQRLSARVTHPLVAACGNLAMQRSAHYFFLPPACPPISTTPKTPTVLSHVSPLGPWSRLLPVTSSPDH